MCLIVIVSYTDTSTVVGLWVIDFNALKAAGKVEGKCGGRLNRTPLNALHPSWHEL